MKTCALTRTQPRTPRVPRPRFLQTPITSSTRERSAYVSLSWHCQRRTLLLCSLIRSSTRYSMYGGSSVFRGLYGDIGTTDCSSSQSCHPSISNSESPRNQRGVSAGMADTRSHTVARHPRCGVPAPSDGGRRCRGRSSEGYFQEFWWFVNPCSPPRIGGEHGIVGEERQIKLFEQHRRLCLQCFENLFDRIVTR